MLSLLVAIAVGSVLINLYLVRRQHLLQQEIADALAVELNAVILKFDRRIVVLETMAGIHTPLGHQDPADC